MTQFLVKAILFVMLVGGFCIGIERAIAPLIRDPNLYVLATSSKERRLAVLGGPRLVIVGGSNVAFGLDSRQLGKAIGRPVVNMGVHGGLGLTFILNEAQAGIHKNDLVVLSPEYYLDTEGDMKLQTQLIDGNPAASVFLPATLAYWVRLIRTNYQRCLSSLFYAWLQTPNPYGFYDKRYFTAEGDAMGYLWFAQPRTQTSRDRLVPKNYGSAIQAMNTFIDVANRKGAKVVFVFPCYARSMYGLNKEAIEHYERQVRTSLHCPILNTPESLLFGDEYIFDTVYHLNKRGKAIRTAKMIAYLTKQTY